MEKLTNAQKSIWITEQYYKGTSVNSICGTATISEKVDFEKLKKAIKIVYEKNDNFRLELKIEEGEVAQVLSEKKEIQISIIDVAAPKDMKKIREKIVKIPFKLENSELFKFYIFRFKNGDGAFMLNIHHLIADAWTLALICNEIIKTYSALKQNKEIETNAIYSYIDYIKSEKEYQKSEKFQKDKNYWNEKFENIPEVAIIPGSKNDKNEMSAEGARKQFEIEASIVEKIKNYCKVNKISLYNFFMAIYSIYIAEITNLDEFVIGTPILNRTNFKEKNSAGMYINMEPFKINFNETFDFKTFVKNIAIDSMNMLKHQKYSYQCLLEDLRKKNKNIPNLYSILLSYQITNTQMSGGDITYNTEWTFNGYCADNMDIQIYDINDTGNLNISYDYKTCIYSGKDVENMHKKILNIIKQIISKENVKIQDIEIVTPSERKQLIFDFNNTKLEYNEKVPIIKYFEKQVETTPNNIAMVFENKNMTYKELNEKANSVATLLRENGVTNNTIVGIMEERSFEMIIAILAVLKAGGAYIPIDPNYPAERIEYMLKDSNASILLTENTKFKTDKKIINISLNSEIYNKNKNNLENISKPEDLSYLIYTSGSTGTPKGVMLKQKNLSNFYNAMKNTIDYLKDGKEHKIISITTVSFDIFGFETLMSLTKGLTLYMTNDQEQKITEKLEQLIKKNEIEIIQTTPSVMKFHLDNLKNKEDLKSLKYIMLAGEPLSKTLVDRLKKIIPDVTIFNGYGPSETTIFSATRNVTDLEEVTIGKPIANTQIYILNINKKLLPQGTIGEIYISGDGVGKGYINKKEQTEKNFIDNPFINGKIMYKVGDLGAFDENGEIHCYGRVDNQIKIRGLRVELPEIEKQMSQIYNIENCVVVKKQVDGRDALCAYYTQHGPVEEKTIKTVLQSKLPQYMIPQYFTRLSEMPFTPNGKIDKKSLPLLELQKNDLQKIIKPRNEIDKELIKIVEKILHIENVSLSDTLLDLGGDSLTAITLSTKIQSKFNVQIFIKDIMSNKTIQEISDIIKNNQTKGISKIKIEKTDIKETYPLSSAQRRIYYNAKMIGEDNIVYNMTGGFIIDEILDQTKVKQILEKIIERHETLRTRFVLHDGDVMQKIEEKIEFDVPVFTNTKNEIDQVIKNFSKPFDLEKAPLFRIEIHYIDNEKTCVLIDTHHIIMDGTGLNNLIIEFCRLYNGDNLKRIPIQYRDYSVWENKFNKSESIKKNENYWLNKFKDSEFSDLNLPYDYKLVTNKTYQGDKITQIIDEKQFKMIEKYAKKIGVSPYIFFVSVFIILLYKYTGQNDITVGSPIANRDINETKRMIGMFVNNIVLRGKINSEESFEEFLNKIKYQVLNDLSYQPYPFDMLVKKLGIAGDNSKNPLFDVMFAYQNKEENIVRLDGKETEIMEINNRISKFNLSIEIKPKTHTINLEYSIDLFNKKTIERLFKHYMNIIDVVMKDCNVLIKDIEIISKDEKSIILNKFNATKMNYPKDKTILELFEEQVEKNPNNIAVIFEDNKITYKELNEKSNQLAHYLRTINSENESISIKLNRSFNLIIAVLAVLKSGTSYILIDPSFPKDRVEYMIKNSNSNLLITSSDLENVESVDCLNIDKFEFEKYLNNNLENIHKTLDLCTLYTSGSTGKPKGVALMKRGFTNLMYAFDKDMEISKYKRILGIATVSFDMFAVELYSSLSFGNTLVLANEEEQKNVIAMSKLIKKHNIEFFVTTPSRVELLLQDECENPLKNVKCFQLGGEKFTPLLLEKLRKYTNAKIYNGYGPTEISACCSNKLVKDNKITIGKPLGNVQIYIYTKDMNLCPIGIVGEICVSGEGVSNGYINNKEMTKKVFVKNPQNNNEILYKTGDLGKFTETGEIEYIGRADTQIKIRGLRIELSEIENAFNEIEDIKQSTVLYINNIKPSYLLAFVIANNKVNVHEIKERLMKKLPLYMIPRYIVQIANFPVTLNGKIDKKALVELANEKVKSDLANTYIPPENDIQKLYCDIWSELLNTKVGIDDDLFDIGADSLLAIKFKTRLLSHNIDLPYSDIFKYKTIRNIVNQNIQNKSDEPINKFDYSSINKLLESQNLENYTFKDDNNALLLGGNGFVGIHILYSFIKNTKGKIYCIIRDKNNVSARKRFEDLLRFYFNDELDKFLDNRIFVLQGNITKEKFGLSNYNYEMLSNNVDVVINSAANVKHYGIPEKFKNINNDTVNTIVEFCLKYNKRLLHISSLSVSGNMFLDGTAINKMPGVKNQFTEKNLYIGQILDNVYSRSKFEGERVILTNVIEKNLNAQILRLGNITSRNKDGKFQINYDENAFANRIRTLVDLKMFPDYLIKEYAEFTPVDKCADAIISILNNQYENMYIYHIFNDNHVTFSNLIKMLKKLNIDIKIVNEKDFKNKIDEILENKEKSASLSGIINDFDNNKKLNYSSDVKISNDITKEVLEKNGFIWPIINFDYMKKYIDYLRKIKFLN